MTTRVPAQQTAPLPPLEIQESEQQKIIAASPQGVRTARKPLHTAIMVIIAASLVAVVGMLYVLQTNSIASLGYAMSDSQRTLEARRIENQRLRAQIAELESLDQIRSIAVDELDMEPYDDYQFLTVAWPEHSETPAPEPLHAEGRSLFGDLLDTLLGRGSSVSSKSEGGS